MTLTVSAAKLSNGKQYLMIPLTAGTNVEVKHFVTAGADGALTLSASFSEQAVWQWKYVSATATSAGHYTLTNVATGGYLFTETDGKVLTSPTDVAVKQASSSVNSAASTFADEQGRFLAINTSGALTLTDDAESPASAFLMMDYVASMTADEIETSAANAVAVAYGIPDAVNQLLPMLQASYTGTRQAERVLSVLYHSQTPADISTQLVEVRRTAVRMLESDLETGATWQQLASGLYICDAGGSLTASTSIGAEGIWYGRFTDNGNTKVEDRTFRLYNNHTKEYLVVDGTTVRTSPTEGTLLSVAYHYGRGLSITSEADKDKNLYIYPGADKTVAIGSEIDDALVYAGEINLYGEGVNSVKPIGPAADEDGTTIYSGINAIELTVARGSEPSADGEITLTLVSDDGSTLLETIDATAAKDPTEKTIDVDYYDNTGTHVTGTREVDVYTLALKQTYSDGGEYIVRVAMGAFTLNGALSSEMAGFTSIAAQGLWVPVVTPEAGNIEALTSITISGPDGVYANPAAGFEGEVDINRDGETLTSYSVAKFAEGGDFDSYDPADASAPWFTIPVNYSATGRYSLHIPRAFFVDNNGAPCADFGIVWEIDEAGITIVTAGTSDAGSAGVDLLGRPATRGLLISKGRKVYVR